MQKVSNIEIKKTSNILRALNHPLRQQIIADIWSAGNTLNVTGVQIMLKLDQSIVSQHLAILRKANIVKSRTVGKNRYYSVNNAEIDRVNTLCKQINNQKN